MFIERNRLNQLNKDIFGGGINQTKKLTPDFGRMVMPDPSLPKIKRYNIRSNNPLGYLINANQQQMPIQPQIQEQENIPPQEISQQPEQDLLSQKLDVQPQEEEINNNNEEQEVPPMEQEPEIKKFSFNDLGENIVLIPPGYSTDDEGEYKLINLLNEPKEKYKLAVESKYAQIYKREVSKILIFNINLNLFIIT
jgi:hypothetical protein